MLTVNYTELRSNLKKYFDEASDNGEMVLVNWKGGKESLVILSLEQYNQMEKVTKLQRRMQAYADGIDQVRAKREEGSLKHNVPESGTFIRKG